MTQLNINKAAGPDGIPADLLRETAEQIAPSLSRVPPTGYGPEDWKLANIVPIFKIGEGEMVNNYRPISLLPILSKCLERCLLLGLRDNMHHLIDHVQHSFVAGKSCVTQLVSVLDYFGSQLVVSLLARH